MSHVCNLRHTISTNLVRHLSSQLGLKNEKIHYNM
jgi:hypothetical protein